jgi:delta24-sterol reductase
MNTRMPDFKIFCEKIDVSNLKDVLEIDEERMQCRMEPLVTMGYVSRFLVPRNLALQCLPEMDDLTVGGLVNGYGVSTASHRFGAMQDAIVELEMVLADGSHIVATRFNQFKDIFFAVPWSHGSLGILVSATIRLVRVKPYIKMLYIPCFSIEELNQRSLRLMEKDVPDFFEATLFSPTTAVIQAAYLSDRSDLKREPSVPVNPIGRWWKPWFYKHVETFLRKAVPDNGGECPQNTFAEFHPPPRVPAPHQIYLLGLGRRIAGAVSAFRGAAL